MANSMAALELRDLSFAYPRREALLAANASMNLTIPCGEILALVGPSAVGKSTLLHLMAGHLRPQAGQVWRSGPTLVIYQKDALLPWLNVEENLQFAMTYALTPHSPGEVRQSARNALVESFQLSPYMSLFPRELSGGLRQRVEVARALLAGAEILLMDEPFSALDALTRVRVRQETFQILRRRRTTVVLVTHDLLEAAQVADRVLVLEPNPCRVRAEVRLEGEIPRSMTGMEFQRSFQELNRFALDSVDVRLESTR
jgi:ABC-type nitrate/sulfonate/bicarbonate transport system ATPase subunit